MITVLETRHVKATRKPWQCGGCLRRFPIGSPKLRQRIVGDFGPYTWEACPACEGIITTLWREDPDRCEEDGVGPEEIEEYMLDHFGTWEAADAHYAKPKLEVVEGGRTG